LKSKPVARRTRSIPSRYRVALVGDGQTECVYFLNVRDTDRPEDLALFPDAPKKIGSYKGVLDKACELVEDYDRVYALIDMDKVIQDKQHAAYATDKAAAEAKGVTVLENNPCFEMWLLLHFSYTTRLFGNCSEVVGELKKHINEYNKSQQSVAKARLYATYRDRINPHAIPNAARLEVNRAGQAERYPRAQTYAFFQWYFGRSK
jgi:hypothetical protein